jgi:hypothetical protein
VPLPRPLSRVIYGLKVWLVVLGITVAMMFALVVIVLMVVLFFSAEPADSPLVPSPWSL